MEEQTVLRSGSSEFKPKARLIKTIGEELISNDIVAIIELVKNSYDANSPFVEIELVGEVDIMEVKDQKDKIIPIRYLKKEGATISIQDVGDGMDIDIIENAWMQPATTFKKERTNSNSDRRFTGEKGIGRFASAKLGDKLKMITKQEQKNEIVVDFDWSLFSNESAFLNEIKIHWDEREPITIKKKGTSLIINNLLSDWDENKIRELRVALSRLLSPLTPMEDFLIDLKLPEKLEDLSGFIERPDTVNKPDYLIKGSIAAGGSPQLIYFSKKNGKEEPLDTETLKDFYLKNPIKRISSVGEFSFEFRVWNREQSSLKLLADEVDRPLKSVKLDLDELSGISIYRDNFRVLPYGNKNNDWLRLDKRRVNNPTMRLSNNQIIGYISIGLDSNPNLKDQSNREGFVDNQAFEDLKEFIRLILNELEIRRYVERPREKDQQTEKSLLEKFSLDELVKYINLNIPNNDTILKIVDQTKSQVKEGLDTLQNTISRYRRLSTLGFMVDIILHDGGNFLNKIDLCSKRIGIELDKETPDLSVIRKKNEEITNYRKELNQLFKRIEPFGGRKRGRPKQVIIEDVIRDQALLHQTILRKSNIGVTLPLTRNEVKIDESELGIILMNLFQNSIYWLDSVDEKKIQIDVFRTEDSLSIIFSDSGPGIREEATEAVFEPYFSTKPDGIGLGLTIIGEIASEYNGELLLINNGPLPGATFKITFKYRI